LINLPATLQATTPPTQSSFWQEFTIDQASDLAIQQHYTTFVDSKIDLVLAGTDTPACEKPLSPSAMEVDSEDEQNAQRWVESPPLILQLQEDNSLEIESLNPIEDEDVVFISFKPAPAYILVE
jgi:hypothetical protein